MGSSALVIGFFGSVLMLVGLGLNLVFFCSGCVSLQTQIIKHNLQRCLDYHFENEINCFGESSIPDWHLLRQNKKPEFDI
jgi:hypothetical protein